MPTRIRKALITAAGFQQRRLPLQSLTDRDGATKPALAIILDEMFAAGIERVGLVLAPGDRPAYEALLAAHVERLEFLEQSVPHGYGHAILCGREFAGHEPFLLQVSDHLYVSRIARSCTQQLLELSETEQCAISAVQATHESQLRFYGTVSASLVPGRAGIYQVDAVIEKPTPTLAEQQCVVPGLRSGHYLCFFGMHVLTPTVFTLLADEAAAAPTEKLGLSNALTELAAREKYFAVEIAGRRADLEAPFGLLRAQISLGLHGSAREEVLALLTEELTLDSTRH